MFDKVKDESHRIDQHVKLKGTFIFSSFHELTFTSNYFQKLGCAMEREGICSDRG